MTEEFGGGATSILNQDEQSGLTNYLKNNGWAVTESGYVRRKLRNGFLATLFKERVFEVVLEKEDAKIAIVHKDKDGKLGMESLYQIRLEGSDSIWKEVKDFKKSSIKQQKRDANLDSLLNL